MILFLQLHFYKIKNLQTKGTLKICSPSLRELKHITHLKFLMISSLFSSSMYLLHTGSFILYFNSLPAASVFQLSFISADFFQCSFRCCYSFDTTSNFLFLILSSLFFFHIPNMTSKLFIKLYSEWREWQIMRGLRIWEEKCQDSPHVIEACWIRPGGCEKQEIESLGKAWLKWEAY